MVDEFRDSSEIQFKLTLLLAGTNDLWVVGDWKQSIYASSTPKSRTSLPSRTASTGSSTNSTPTTNGLPSTRGRFTPSSLSRTTAPSRRSSTPPNTGYSSRRRTGTTSMLRPSATESSRFRPTPSTRIHRSKRSRARRNTSRWSRRHRGPSATTPTRLRPMTGRSGRPSIETSQFSRGHESSAEICCRPPRSTDFRWRTRVESSCSARPRRNCCLRGSASSNPT